MHTRAVIATHHKTGTLWMEQTFTAAAGALGIACRAFNRTAPEAAACEAPVVLLDPHAAWFGHAAGHYRRAGDRVFHLIRDPRDVIISAMHYHCVAGEAWLDAPRAEFGGESYRARLAALAGERERLVFEMDHNAGKVIAAMARWNYAHPECFECKYEDLVADRELRLFTRAALHLGFSDGELTTCGEAFRRAAIFGGRAGAVGKSRHMRSGAAGQWRGVFDQELARAFLDRFGDVLARLGYEDGDSWRDSLAPAREAGRGAA